ncbi:hypothetical protein ABW20_dc0106218 [Dactylellina cionopaga]|nr:hypothetical protein ABW20_dc0106218 [Dactylellina cionopaga]
MYHSRLNIILVAIITLVSLCTASTVIISQTCAPRYCDHYVSKVYRTTKIIHRSTPYTVIRWKTVTKPKATSTVLDIRSIETDSTSTIRTITLHFTKWVGTSTHIRKFTVTSPTYTETGDITTRTITPPTHTVPTPSGFVPVADDPDNRAHVKGLPLNRRNVEPEPLNRRNAEPEPNPEPKPEPEPEPVVAAAKKYTTAVTCTKIYLTKTGTSDLWKTTTKTTGTTTKTVFTSTTIWTTNIHMVTANNVVTTRTTTTAPKVAFASSTLTIYTGATTYLTTATTYLPVPTYWAACGTRNQGPPVWQQSSWVGANAGPDPDEVVDVIMSNGHAYDCCVECFTYNKGGRCIGSVYQYIGPWGPPICDEWDEDCHEWEPEFNSRCTLVITPNKPGTCRRHRYEYYWWPVDPPLIVSNGPSCARFKYRLPGQPL